MYLIRSNDHEQAIQDSSLHKDSETLKRRSYGVQNRPIGLISYMISHTDCPVYFIHTIRASDGMIVKVVKLDKFHVEMGPGSILLEELRARNIFIDLQGP